MASSVVSNAGSVVTAATIAKLEGEKEREEEGKGVKGGEEEGEGEGEEGGKKEER